MEDVSTRKDQASSLQLWRRKRNQGDFQYFGERGKKVREVSYFPGCSLHGTAKEYDESIQGVSGLLDIRLHELENWTCCGASSAHCMDEALALALPARNLAIAQKSDRELLVPCVACYNRFKVTEQEAKDHPERLSFSYRGNVAIRYALDFFSEGST